MLIDAVSFMIILSCYFFIVATIFTMLFQSVDDIVDPDDGLNAYTDLSHSLRTLYVAMLGGFQYTALPNYEMSNSILTTFHVFLSNIFLINFLVAILSATYENMIDYGEFNYKCNLYEYIEKYSIAMLDEYGYSELIYHPPPLNLFSIFIWPAVFSPSIMKQAARGFSKMMFWLENVLYIMIFMISEVLLSPIIYFKLAV